MRTTSVGSTISVEAMETDPYPIYQRLRDEEPVSWVESLGLWLVTRWDGVRTVDLSPKIFTAETNPSTLNRTFGKNLLGSDGPYHEKLRAVIQPAFLPPRIRAYNDEVILSLAHDLIDRFVARGQVDIMAEFAEPLSIGTLKALLGLRDVPQNMLRDWFVALATGASNFEGNPAKQAIADEASRAVDWAITGALEQLARTPDNTIISSMVNSEIDGQRLTHAEILANLKVMIVGGMQEPGDLMGLALWALLSHPDQAAEVIANRTLLKPAVEEALRWHSPVGTSTRQVLEKTSIAGVELEVGALVAAVLASANRDERHWTDPDRFDIHRQEGTHVAFALGGHFCVGAPLARQETTTAFTALFDRLPNLRLDPDYELQIRGWEFRRPQNLHVRWDV